MNGPLSWLRVVDLTDIRGALCARILADLGADVVRVDSPSEPPGSFETTEYRYRNANKRGARLDLETLTGRDRLDTLLAEADVLVENFDASVRDRLGLGCATVSAAHPRMVHVALADLGLSGPRASWHLEALPALAASGALFTAGFPELPPCNGPGYVAQIGRAHVLNSSHITRSRMPSSA
jgi:CoA:oxalate CoA-transferase